MTRVDELLVAVEKLSVSEQAEFVRRLHKWEDDEWDKQIIADHDAGKLDSLISEARDDLRHGRDRELP
jgi:hypothetical protein